MQNLIPMVPVDATQSNPAIRLAKGRYQMWRRVIAGVLTLLFLLAPWLQINGAPLLWMDLPNRELHLLGLTLWPDDLIILIWVSLAAALGLFTVATFSGRLWCGFACPQTIWSMMFTWVEEKTQGSRNQRLKELSLPVWQRRLIPMILKHLAWWFIALVTAFTFVAFFETGEVLSQALLSLELDGEQQFWLGFFAILTYLNAGWLREQVCLHMCPYARFQSVMMDQKSLRVHYQSDRGEPRKEEGDCVDCQLCVQVCPVGIDIRQGLQYACIDCGACIDACDDIMTKINKPKGLINFSYPGFSKKTFTDLFKNRAKLWGYGACTVASVGLLLLQLNYLEKLDAHLSRDRGQLYHYNSQGHIANSFTLKVHNKNQIGKQYNIQPVTPGLTLSQALQLELPAGDKRTVAFQVICLEPCSLTGAANVDIQVKSLDGEDELILSSRFFAPRI